MTPVIIEGLLRKKTPKIKEYRKDYQYGNLAIEFHDHAESMRRQLTAVKEKEPGFTRNRRVFGSGLIARRFPRQNVEGDEGEENDKQRAKQKKITGYKIAKWIKTYYIRRKEELEARITEETWIMLIEMEQQTRKATAAQQL